MSNMKNHKEHTISGEDWRRALRAARDRRKKKQAALKKRLAGVPGVCLSGGMKQKDSQYQPGDRVFLKPEWQDSGDDKIVITAIEDRGNRVYAKFHTGLALASTEVLPKYMLATAGGAR